jgi:putative membrane protein
MDIFIPYLHFIGIMVMMGTLITEHVILKPDISLNNLKSLGIIDLIYGISAVIVLITGLLRWFVVGKGAEFYTKNPIFHTKLTLFVVIFVLSIFPTIKFIKWSRQARRGQKPNLSEKLVKRQLMFIRIQLLLLAVLPLLAVMIARGMGLR